MTPSTEHQEPDEALLRALIRHSADALAVIDHSGIIRYVSPAVERLIGLPSHEVVGTSAFERLHPDDVAPSLQKFGLMLAADRDDRGDSARTPDGHTATIEFRVRTGDGSYRWLEATATNRLDDPAVRGVIATYRDVTTRRSAENDRALLAALVASSEDAIIAYSLDGIILSWNPGAERLYGYTAAEAVGHSVSMLVPPKRLHDVSTITQRLTAGERILHFETTRLHRGGDEVHVSLAVSPIVDPSGRVVGASVIARDIGDRIRREEQRDAIARLDGAMLIVRTVAHELNNALAPVVGFADLLALRPSLRDDLDALRFVRQIAEAGELATSKVRQLQHIVRLERAGDPGAGNPAILDLQRSTDEPPSPPPHPPR